MEYEGQDEGVEGEDPNDKAGEEDAEEETERVEDTELSPDSISVQYPH